MDDAPADPQQRKADMLACPRWILTSLHKERLARKELEQQVVELQQNQGQSLSQDAGALEQQLAQLKQQRLEENERIKKLLLTKEQEYSGILTKIQELERLNNEKDIQIQRITEELSKWKDYAKKQQQAQDTIEQVSNEKNSELISTQKKLAQANEKLQEYLVRCQTSQTELQQCEEKLRKKTEELNKINEWMKEVQQKKKESDERVRKLVEQKSQVIAEKMDQIAKLKGELEKYKRNSVTRSLPGSSARPQSVLLNRDSKLKSASKMGGAISEAMIGQLLSQTSDLSGPSFPNPPSSPGSPALNDQFAQKMNQIQWKLLDWIEAPSSEINTFQFSRKQAKTSLSKNVDITQLPPIKSTLSTKIIQFSYLEKLLLSNELSFIKKIIPIFEEGSAEQLSDCLTNLLEYLNPALTIELIRIAVISDVQVCNDVNTLFRGNSVASKVMSKYSRIVGTNYLTETLTPVFKLLTSSSSFEIDPTKMDDTDDPKKNLDNLTDYAQLFFDAIINSFEKIPLQFRIVTHHLGEIVKKTFPDAPYFGVVNFIFLRFFCVAIATPLAFGFQIKLLQEEKPKRGLVLISKMLQSLANQSTFKESYMLPLNEWSNNNRSSLNNFFAKLTLPPQTCDPSAFTKDQIFLKPKNDYLKLLNTLLSTKEEQVLQNIPPEFTQKSISIIQTKTGRLLDSVLNCLLPQIQQKKFNKDDEVVKLLFAMLFNDDAFNAAIAEQTMRAIQGRDRDSFAKTLLTLFAKSKKSLPIIEYWADIEVDIDGDIIHNSMTSKLISKYLQIHGQPIATYLLRDLIDNVISRNINLEIDEDRMTETQAQNKAENGNTLIKLCEDWSNEILKRVHNLPREFWKTFSFLAIQKQQVIGPLFLWSIICPIIEYPETFGLTNEPPNLKTRRTLTIIADIFLKIAKDNYFYLPGAIYEQLDAFIRKKTEPFCQELQNWASSRHVQSATTLVLQENLDIEWSTVSQALCTLCDFLQQQSSFIQTYVSNSTIDWPIEYNIKEIAAKLLSKDEL